MLLLLLDADVIIDLHKLGAWEQITKSHSVHIPSIILHQEVYYFTDDKGNRHPINLENEIGKSIHEREHYVFLKDPHRICVQS